MLICSKSTKNYFPKEEDVRIITDTPTIDILKEKNRYEAVIAVGGGAVIDTAKILAENVVCFPTTAAGAANTSHSVYWDGVIKKSVKRNLPKKVYIVNKFVSNLPDKVKEYTTYDVISHCLDSMWSVYKTKKSAYYVDCALEILKGQYSNADLVFAGNLAGSAIEICPTTLLHSLSYPLTGFYQIPHGKALGFLLPAVCTYMGFDLGSYIDYPKIKLCNIDFELIIKESLKYGKINNVVKKVNLDEIKAMWRG